MAEIITITKSAEQLFKDSPEKLRSMLDALPVCISFFDKEQRYWFNNKTYKEWFGISRQEIEGKHIREILGENTYESVRGHIEKALSGQNVSYHAELPDRDDGVRHVEVSLIPSYNGDGDVAGCYAYVYDITAQIKAEEAWKSSSDRLRSFMDYAPVFMYIKDRSLKHVFANKSLLNYFNVSLDEFIGTTTSDYLPDNMAKLIEDKDREIVEKECLLAMDDYQVRFSDRILWVKEIKFPVKLYDGEVGVGGIVVDITQQKRSEEKLTEQLGFERLIAEIAAKLAQTKKDQLKETIDWTLKSLGQFLHTERAFIAQFSEDGNSLFHTNYWAAEGISLPISLCEMNMADELPFFAQQIRNGRIFNVGPGLSGLPDDEKLRTCLESEGINSGIVVPVRVEGKSVGMLGLDTVVKAREYSQSVVERLRLVADMIGSLLIRVRSDKKLRKAYDEIKLLKENLEVENIYLRDQISVQSTHQDIIGKSDAMKYVLYRIKQVAPSDSTVMILGETGTGKELVAEAIHNESSRRNRSLVKVNCAALPSNLIESELFGREKGAFTGSQARQVGRFELADKGTLFLDEVGELPIELQAKLLRVIQSGEFERLGSPHTIKVDVRIIASTNRDLIDEVKKGRFREDLYYRLNVFPITVPPLRERKEDVSIIVKYFLKKFEKKIGKKIERVPYDVIQTLQDYHWPGNVRELENIIERSMIISPNSTLHLADRLEISQTQDSGAVQRKSLTDMERDHILRVLEETRWKIEGKNGAAQILDVNPSTLRSRMRKLGIQKMV